MLDKYAIKLTIFQAYNTYGKKIDSQNTIGVKMNLSQPINKVLKGKTIPTVRQRQWALEQQLYVPSFIAYLIYLSSNLKHHPLSR